MTKSHFKNMTASENKWPKNNSPWKVFALIAIGLILPMTTSSNDIEDPIYQKCIAQKEDPGPWCYLEEVKKAGDPDLCENILKYWPKATGVHGQCYYELAIKKKDCQLCKKIEEKDIKKMCELDACQ